MRHNYYPIQAPQLKSTYSAKKKVGIEGERKIYFALIDALKDDHEYFFRYSLPQKNL
jgi:hypothetical protein